MDNTFLLPSIAASVAFLYMLHLGRLQSSACQALYLCCEMENGKDSDWEARLVTAGPSKMNVCDGQTCDSDSEAPLLNLQRRADIEDKKLGTVQAQ